MTRLPGVGSGERESGAWEKGVDKVRGEGGSRRNGARVARKEAGVHS